MKLVRMAAAAAIAGIVLIANSATAQVSKEGMGKVLPVEIYACKFNEGKGMADLEAVISRWNQFMDDKKINTYAAWTLTPYYFTEEQDFDVIWLGAYKDGNAFGSGTDTWLASGGELAAAYNEVVTCAGHIGLSSAMYKAPAANVTPASGIITMMDCKLNKGHRYSDIKAAEIKWAKYLTDSGSRAGYWHWFPTFGGGDADFDYKVVFSYENFTQLGADYERIANGGGREMSQDVFDDIDDCDDARVYVATSRRATKLRD